MRTVFLAAAIVVVGGAGFAFNYLKPSASEASSIELQSSSIQIAELRGRFLAEDDGAYISTLSETEHSSEDAPLSADQTGPQH